MYQIQAITDIEAGWHSQIEADLETGARPVFELGFSHATRTVPDPLLALYRLANLRTDVTAPLFVIGGSDALWLAAMFYPDTFHRLPRSPHLQFLFAGADIATYLATFAAFSRQNEGSLVVETEMGYGATTYHDHVVGTAHHIFSAGTQTGAIVDWASFPIVALVSARRHRTEPADVQPDQAIDWLAWVVLLFAVALLLLAMIV